MGPKRTSLILSACLLALTGLAAAQPPAAAPVDRKDPAAVAQAYMDAVRQGKVDDALALLTPDENQAMIGQMVRAVAGDLPQQGFNFWDIFQEFVLLPIGVEMTAEAGPAQQGDGTVTVPVRRVYQQEAKVVLKQQADGTYAVDLIETIKQTTGRDQSFLVSEFGNRGGGQQGPGDEPWRCQEHLRALSQGLTDYANEHDGKLPEAATWCDDILPYVLDRENFSCPAAAGFECAYAYNSDVAGQELPKDWQARREVVLLFESDLGVWNAAAPAADMPTELKRHTQGLNIATAEGNTITIPLGLSLADAQAQWRDTDTCQQRLSALCQAARAYAKDNGGRLPAGDTWSDDLAPYLADQRGGGGPDALVCPARPDLRCAYTMNEELAGADIGQLVGYRRLVLFFETDDDGYDVAAPVQTATKEARHLERWGGWGAGGGYEVGYLDGHTELRQAGQPAAAGR